MKSFLFKSGDPSTLFKPVEEWGEKVKICNNSTTTYLTQTIISALEISTNLDELQPFDHCNPNSIDDDMTILGSTIATQFQEGIILVCYENCNNLTTNDLFQSVRSELERSTPVDARRVVDHQNPTST
jgi:hypothetical protein